MPIEANDSVKIKPTYSHVSCFRGDLEPLYSDNLPTANRRLNAPFFLYHHLNHPANAQTLQTLCVRVRALGAPAERILRLTCRRLFTPGAFPTEGRQHIARGASAHVVRCRAPAYIRKMPAYEAARALGALNPGLEKGLEESSWVALKMVNVPGSVHDPCVFHDLYSEVGFISFLSSFLRVARFEAELAALANRTRNKLLLRSLNVVGCCIQDLEATRLYDR